MADRKSYNLLDNSRFYILMSSLLLSGAIAAYLRLNVQSDQLYVIRLQQVFGLLAVAYWYLTLCISPIGYIIGKQRIKRLEFARRAIGVSAAYFALLHSAVALWGQLGGLGNVALLPQFIQWSLAGGTLALTILLIMAATSLNKIITYMTFPKWKWLHRLVYVGGVAAALHIWSIGTHLTYDTLQWLAFGALALLSGLETFRMVTLFTRKHRHLQRKDYFFMIATTIWILWLVMIACIPALVQNYHSQHVERDIQSPASRGHHD